VLFWRLGTPSFWDPDEAHYAQTTRELIATGDWAAPYYNQQPFFDKPILFYWLQAVPMTVLGSTELAARIVPATACLILIGTTIWLGFTLLSWDAAVVAGLLLTVSPGVFALARYAILDSVFTAFLFGGAACIAVSVLRRRPALEFGGYVLIALAVLTKGPLAIVLCGLTFLLAIGLSSEARRCLLGLHWVAGLLIAVGIAAPWFVYMWLRFGRAFLTSYMLDENISLYATNRFGPGESVWFYFRILAAGLLPWTGLVVGRFVDYVRAILRRERIDVFETLLWAWTAAIVGFFSLSKFKLDHYVFPVTPALCLLCARSWVELGERPGDPALRGSRLGLHLVGPLFVAVGLGAGVFLISRLELPAGAMVAPAAIGIAGAVVTAFLNVRGGRPVRTPPIFIPAAMGIAYATIILYVVPALEQRKVMPDIGRWVASHAQSADRVATYGLNRWNTAFRFYVDRQVDVLDAVDAARQLFNGSEPFYCVMPARLFDEFVAQGAPLRVAYAREGIWTTSGRVLWRRRIPPARFVVAAPIAP